MEGPHPTVSSVKMADALTRYISNYKFKFKFSLKIENCELKKKKKNHKFLFSYIYTDVYIVCFSMSNFTFDYQS